jgi:hypothetical protein
VGAGGAAAAAALHSNASAVEPQAVRLDSREQAVAAGLGLRRAVRVRAVAAAGLGDEVRSTRRRSVVAVAAKVGGGDEEGWWWWRAAPRLAGWAILFVCVCLSLCVSASVTQVPGGGRRRRRRRRGSRNKASRGRGGC